MKTNLTGSSDRSRPPQAYPGKDPAGIAERLCYGFLCIMMVPILLFGCSPFNERHQARPAFEAANDFFSQGNYPAALNKYLEIVEKFPMARDRARFEMGIIYVHPKNEQKDYQKALGCFQELIKDYPESAFRQDSEMMIFYIDNVIVKDKLIAMQQAQIEMLRQEVNNRENDIVALQKDLEALERKAFNLAILNGKVDKILIEKQARRLTLVLNGEELKTYRIALGGDPVGPKERQGDNKTPEGTYFIESRNLGSSYHLSLRISYPNESDRRRARELGVSPGGDIMIHGIKNGFSWVGEAHAEVDWTKGCIAVTDEEIEEIAKLAPNGTLVEIRP